MHINCIQYINIVYIYIYAYVCTYLLWYNNSFNLGLMQKVCVMSNKNNRSVIFVLIERSSGNRSKTFPNLFGWSG